jgi:chemotaxis protein MotB
MSDQPIVIIKKKKAAHAAHHGGSWKVAYADFVTAMMAFFMVMWIISMDQPSKEAIQNYFNDPFSASNSKAGISKLAAGGRSPLATGFAGAMNDKTWWPRGTSASQFQNFLKAQEQLEKAIQERPELKALGKNVEITVRKSGLVIELIEAKDSLFFESGSAVLPPASKELLSIVAKKLGTLPNPISVEGHTDSVPYSRADGYGNWELSADRANATRRFLETTGLRPRQVQEVRGYADTQPRDRAHPTSRVNRRVSIMVNYDEHKSAGGGGDTPASDAPFDLGIRPE